MKHLFFAVGVGLVIGCGGSAQAPVTTSAAPSPAISEAPAPSAEAPPASEASSDPPPAGHLECRAVDAVDGTNELYLTWDGNEATGVIRSTTQSGMRHEQRVKAERADGIIVVDDPHESDLVTHAAVLQKQGGSLKMRLGKGMSGNWVACTNP